MNGGSFSFVAVVTASLSVFMQAELIEFRALQETKQQGHKGRRVHRKGTGELGVIK